MCSLGSVRRVGEFLFYFFLVHRFREYIDSGFVYLLSVVVTELHKASRSSTRTQQRELLHQITPSSSLPHIHTRAGCRTMVSLALLALGSTLTNEDFQACIVVKIVKIVI